jgi:acyl-CoA thioester hydrolase
MPKPDPALLDPARYPFHTDIATRFADLDVNLHINNVAMVGLLETGRVLFHRASGFVEALGEGLGAMVVSLAVEYLGQGYFPDPVQMHAGALSIGTRSYTLAHLVTQGGRTVAYAQGVMVCVRDGAPAPIPEAFATSVAQWMVRP